MQIDPEALKFSGKAQRIAEEEFAATFGGDTGNRLMDRLWAEYVQAGKPRTVREWIRARLTSVFPAAGERPRWVGGVPQWPWLDGKPMVFLRQFPIGTTPVEQSLSFPPFVAYVFALRVPHEAGGFEMQYRVVQDGASLRGLAVKPSSI